MASGDQWLEIFSEGRAVMATDIPGSFFLLFSLVFLGLYKRLHVGRCLEC
jgi:hypothetical protein